MAAPAFVQASAGAVVTTGTSTVSLTGCTAGNLVFLVWFEDGGSNDSDTGVHVNTSTVAGVASDLDFFQVIGAGGNGTLHVFIGRVTANGTISADMTVGASGADLFVVWYEFSGASTATVLAAPNGITENTSGDYYGFSGGTGTSITFDICQSTDVDRLGITFIGVNANQALANMTGESNGDFTKPVSEFASSLGTAGTVGIQTAPMPTAVNISGGSIAISSASWATISFALKPAPVVATSAEYSTKWLSAIGW